MKNVKAILLFLLLGVVSSCDNYLDIQPVGQVIPISDSDYRAIITKAYSVEKNHKVLLTYRADELQLESSVKDIEYYKDIYIWNDDNTDPLTSRFPYSNFYNTIFYLNHIIAEQNNIEGDKTKIQQLVGEAYALRAYQYFQLINLYAKPYDIKTSVSDKGVPIVVEYDTEQNYTRSTVKDCYDFIEKDIAKAQKLLNISQQEVGHNYRFSKLALLAFKARVYLHQRKWESVVDQVQEALSIKSAIVDLNQNKELMPSQYNSVESILSLDRVASYNIGFNDHISDSLVNAYDKNTDLRFDLYFKKNNDKYQSRKNADSKYRCSIRTSDLYLMMAEAYAELDQLNTSKQVLINFVKNRYNTQGFEVCKKYINNLNKPELITEILKERQREFAIEGLRWYDLRRTTQPKITKEFAGQTYVLSQNDGRYVVPFPKDATINNPYLN